MYIQTGRVTVNGKVVTQLGTCVDPVRDVVMVDGIRLKRPTIATIMLHKPAGYVTTCGDRHARNTVMDLVPEIPGLHPIGRLDQDSTGLLLLTNDGKLTFALTHPRHHVDKTYRTWVSGAPEEKTLVLLRRGVKLTDGLTAPAQVFVKQIEDARSLLEITIHEGKNRQIRRMLQFVGHPVLSLTRVQIGSLRLTSLPEGHWRELSPHEIEALYDAAE